MHHPFRDALAVEVLQLLDQVEVLQQQRAARAGAERVLVVGDRNPGGGGQRWFGGSLFGGNVASIENRYSPS
jgi:hypothetical protein